MKANTKKVYARNEVATLSLKELLKRVGPGMILTGIVIGPGAITTASMIGATYGYALMWLFIPIIFMGITFVLTTYRISILTEKPILEAIQHYYGSVSSKIVGTVLFIAGTFFTIGNISGTGMGMNLIFGIDWKLGAIVMIGLLMIVYFSKGVYSKVEKIVTLCVIGMIIAFYITLVGTGGPDWGGLGTSMLHWSFPAGSLTTAIAFISTNASVTSGIYGTYLGKEKKWKTDDLFNGVMLTDSISHMIGVSLISGAIVLVGAIVLNPSGTVVSSPAQLAEMLVPVLGNMAKYIMGIALLGAGFSSLLGNTQRAVVLLNAGYEKPTSLDSKRVKYGSVIVIAVSAFVAFAYGGSPIQLILIANLSTSIATPIAGLFLCLMISRKDINEGYPEPKLLKYSMYISYLFYIILTVPTLVQTVSKLLQTIF